MLWKRIKESFTTPNVIIICCVILGILFGLLIVNGTESKSDFSYEMKEVELSDGSYVNCLVTTDGNDHTMQCDWQHRTVKGQNYD